MNPTKQSKLIAIKVSDPEDLARAIASEMAAMDYHVARFEQEPVEYQSADSLRMIVSHYRRCVDNMSLPCSHLTCTRHRCGFAKTCDLHTVEPDVKICEAPWCGAVVGPYNACMAIKFCDNCRCQTTWESEIHGTMRCQEMCVPKHTHCIKCEKSML